MTCHVDVTWDVEGAVWAATSRDLPGLALEDPSLESLMERVRQAAPALLTQPGDLVFRYDAPTCR